MVCSSKQANLDDAPSMRWEDFMYCFINHIFMTINSNQTICLSTVASPAPQLPCKSTVRKLNAEPGTGEVGKAKRHYLHFEYFSFQYMKTIEDQFGALIEFTKVQIKFFFSLFLQLAFTTCMHQSMPGAGRVASVASGNKEMRLVSLSITDKLNQFRLMAKHKFRNQKDFV